MSITYTQTPLLITMLDAYDRLDRDLMSDNEKEAIRLRRLEIQKELHHRTFGMTANNSALAVDVKSDPWPNGPHALTGEEEPEEDVCETIEKGFAELFTADKRIALAKQILFQYSQIDGSHHKAWCLDQIARALCGPDFALFVQEYCDGEDGPDSYEWDEGCAP